MRGLSYVLSPFHPFSTCPRAPLRRKCCSGAAFWTTRCCYPLARPSSVKSLVGFALSSQTRPTGFAWVSSLPSQPSLHSGFCLFVPTHLAISANWPPTSPSQGCRGSGRCLQANPKWLKTLLPLRARSQVTNAGELLIASWPEGPAATVDLGRSGAAEDRLWMCHSPGRCLTWLCTQRTVSCLLL